jgi:hypothetical protein
MRAPITHITQPCTGPHNTGWLRQWLRAWCNSGRPPPKQQRGGLYVIYPLRGAADGNEAPHRGVLCRPRALRGFSGFGFRVPNTGIGIGSYRYRYIYIYICIVYIVYNNAVFFPTQPLFSSLSAQPLPPNFPKLPKTPSRDGDGELDSVALSPASQHVKTHVDSIWSRHIPPVLLHSGSALKI